MTALTRLTSFAVLTALVAATAVVAPAPARAADDEELIFRTMPHGETVHVDIDPVDEDGDGTRAAVLTPGQSNHALLGRSGTTSWATIGRDGERPQREDDTPVIDTEGATPDTLTPRASFSTLSAALVGEFADRQGVTVETFLAANAMNGPSVLPGVDGALDVASLDQRLAAGGLSFDGTKVSSLRAWTADLAASPSVDSAVTLLAAGWAEQALGTAMPKLKGPGSLGQATLSDESLLFGLFAKESLTDLVANHPDVFGQVTRTGLGTPAGQQKFRDSMLTTWDRIDGGLGAGLLDGCSAGFMAVMASGDPAAGKIGGSDCGGCAAAGLGANHMMNRLFDFGTGANSTLFQPGDDMLAMQEWVALQDWVAGALVDATPQIQNLGNQKLPSGVCDGGAATGAISTTLPDLFAGLKN